MDHFSCSGVSFLDLFIFLTTAVSGSQRIYPKFPSITKIFNLHRTILPLLLLLLRDRLLLLSFHLCVEFKYTAMKVQISGVPRGYAHIFLFYQNQLKGMYM